MSVKLSTVELSRRLADSPLTRSDCAILRPLAVPTLADSLGDVSRNEKRTQAEGQPGDSMRGDPASGGCPRAVGADAPLPCLLENNSIGGSGSAVLAVGSPIPSWVRKAGFIVKTNIHAMTDKHGIDRIGFLTLTFADDVQDHKEAAKRFNSLATNVLNVRYAQWIRVSERQKSGRWHFHLVIVCKQDIRRGIDFAGIARRDYASANKHLRSEWAFWRSTSKKYGFGRTELLPVKKTGEALAAYVAKYISKGFAYRRDSDKGARLVSYSKNARVCGSRFAFVGGKAQEWRLKLRLWVAATYARYYRLTVQQGLEPLPHFEYDQMADLFGKRWAWKYRDNILLYVNPFPY